MVNRISDLFALLGWLSVLVLAWFIILQRVQNNAITWLVFAFFVLFSTIATLIAASYPAKK